MVSRCREKRVTASGRARQAHRPLGADPDINQARALVLTGPDDLRTRYTRLHRIDVPDLTH